MRPLADDPVPATRHAPPASITGDFAGNVSLRTIAVARATAPAPGRVGTPAMAKAPDRRGEWLLPAGWALRRIHVCGSSRVMTALTAVCDVDDLVNVLIRAL